MPEAPAVTLEDRYVRERGAVYLSGMQALVRRSGHGDLLRAVRAWNATCAYKLVAALATSTCQERARSQEDCGAQT